MLWVNPGRLLALQHLHLPAHTSCAVGLRMPLGPWQLLWASSPKLYPESPSSWAWNVIWTAQSQNSSAGPCGGCALGTPSGEEALATFSMAPCTRCPQPAHPTSGHVEEPHLLTQTVVGL